MRANGKGWPGRGVWLLASAVAMGALGCDDTPTTAVVDNAFPDVPSAPVTVYRTWWAGTLFPDPVPPGAWSAPQRATPADDVAYALLAPGWTPAQGTPPTDLVAVRSAAPLVATEHETLHIAVDDTRFLGNCAAGAPLTPEDASLIVERIFRREFAGATYDPATCTTTPGTGAAGPSAAVANGPLR